MRRTIQGLVSRQSVLAQAQLSSMIYLANPYVCFSCRKYLFKGLFLGEGGGTAAFGGRGEKIDRQLQQQRGIHVAAKNMKEKGIDWDQLDGFRGGDKGQFEALDEISGDEYGDSRGEQVNGRGRISLRTVILSPEQQQYIDERTASFSQLRDESDVGSPESLGKKLVDNRAFIASIWLWRILLGFKRRLYQDVGVREIWNGMQIRGVDLPVRGPYADTIWSIFLKSALRDDEFFGEIWRYIQDLDSRRGNRRAWDGVYDTIVGHFLVADPSKVRKWHQLLYPLHSSRSLPELFTDVLQKRPDAQPQLREIHAMVKTPAGIYTTMIPSLCKLGLHAEAVRWHRHCLSFADLPEDTSVANDLIKWMAKYGSVEELKQLLSSFVETGVRVVESSLITILIARPDKLEGLRFILARSNEFDIAAMGDKFWAHVMSQQNLEKVDVYRYLATFGEGLVVGRETVEATMKRFELPEDKAVLILSEIGITFKGHIRSRDSTPGSSFPTDGFWGTEITERGPRTMEELASSLQDYLTSRDWGKFDSTLCFPSPGPPDTKVHNILLQADLLRGRLPKALYSVERMRISSIAISTPSLQLLVATFLRPRRPGAHPDTWADYLEDDLFLVIDILFSLLRSNVTEVAPFLWREVFKRLGMARRLSDIETLATGLVEWYHPTRSISTRRRLARTTVITSPAAETPTAAGDTPPVLPSFPHSPIEIPMRSRENPLRKLFPRQFIAAIISWGFLTFRPYSRTTMPLIPSPPSPAERNLPTRYADWAGCVSNFTWGISLTKRLHELGVHVDARSVKRAVRVRLIPVFYPPQGSVTPKKSNRLAAAINYLTLEEVVDIVERAWGESLYKREGWEKIEKSDGEDVSCEAGGDGLEDKERENTMRSEVLGGRASEEHMHRRQRIWGGWRFRRKKKQARM